MVNAAVALNYGNYIICVLFEYRRSLCWRFIDYINYENYIFVKKKCSQRGFTIKFRLVFMEKDVKSKKNYYVFTKDKKKKLCVYNNVVLQQFLRCCVQWAIIINNSFSLRRRLFTFLLCLTSLSLRWTKIYVWKKKIIYCKYYEENWKKIKIILFLYVFIKFQ